MMIVTLDLLSVAGCRVAETLRSLGRLFATMLLVSLAAIWLLFIGIMYESYLNAWNATSAFAGNVEALLSFDIARNIELYELSMKAAADGFADPAILALPPKIRQKVLFDQSAKASGLGSITIFDKSGSLVADSHFERPQNYSAVDRDYFLVHAGKLVPRGLYVSHPFKSRLHDDLWTVALSRRLDGADGSFAGVVIGTLKLSYFLHLFGAVQMPETSVITLVHEDGTVLMRSRLVDIGRNLNTSGVYREMTQLQRGEITRVSQIDGVKRLYHFGTIDHLPIMLIVGLPIDDVLATWRWRMACIALGFAILSVFILLLAVALGRELRRRTLAERALVELAATDSMTALANRRHFDQALEEEWSRA